MIISKIDYINFTIYFVVAFSLASLVLGVSLFLSPKLLSRDFEKLGAYECGFEPFSSAREPFSIQFYLVGIMFIVFDVELIFLFPWVLCLSDLSIVSIWAMYAFLALLGVGFVYELQKGILSWTVISFKNL